MKKLFLLFGIFAMCSCSDDNGVSSKNDLIPDDGVWYDTTEYNNENNSSDFFHFPQTDNSSSSNYSSSSSYFNTSLYSSSEEATLYDVCITAANLIADNYQNQSPEVKCTEYVNVLQYVNMSAEDAVLCIDYVGCTDIILNLYGSSNSNTTVTYCNMDNYCEKQVQAELAGMGVGKGSGATKTIEERCGCIFNN